MWLQFPQELFLSEVMGGRRSRERPRPDYSVGGSEVCGLRGGGARQRIILNDISHLLHKYFPLSYICALTVLES